MKGAVGPGGELKIIRNGLLRKMTCPYAAPQPRCCGEWCPLFDDSDKDIGEVQLCNGNRIFMQRKKEK